MTTHTDEELQHLVAQHRQRILNAAVTPEVALARGYRSAETRQWEAVQLDDWRGAGVPRIERSRREHDGKTVIKEEKMPDGRSKLILKDEATGEFVDVVS